jgi:hypothetical protein
MVKGTPSYARHFPEVSQLRDTDRQRIVEGLEALNGAEFRTLIRDAIDENAFARLLLGTQVDSATIDSLIAIVGSTGKGTQQRFGQALEHEVLGGDPDESLLRVALTSFVLAPDSKSLAIIERVLRDFQQNLDLWLRAVALKASSNAHPQNVWLEMVSRNQPSIPRAMLGVGRKNPWAGLGLMRNLRPPASESEARNVSEAIRTILRSLPREDETERRLRESLAQMNRFAADILRDALKDNEFRGIWRTGGVKIVHRGRLTETPTR